MLLHARERRRPPKQFRDRRAHALPRTLASTWARSRLCAGEPAVLRRHVSAAYRRARHAPPLSEAAPNHAGLRHRGTQALAAPFGRLLETAAGGLPPPRAG